MIDVHVHAMDGTFPGVAPMCPKTSKFIASDPKGEGTATRLGERAKYPSTLPVRSGRVYKRCGRARWSASTLQRLFLAIQRACRNGSTPDPARVIPGTFFSNGLASRQRASLDELRKDFTKDGFKVMGEIGLQYEGISPSDPSVDAYFALAEELDIPVAIHMGTGGSGGANITMPKFRDSMGNPLLLEELLARHPKLRVQVMHAGYPMIDNMLKLLLANSHVYVDVAGLIWSYPIKEVNRYIERLVEAGFEDRVMFGTDQLLWPKLMAYSISIIENADYLTRQQKRDILCTITPRNF